MCAFSVRTVVEALSLMTGSRFRMLLRSHDGDSLPIHRHSAGCANACQAVARYDRHMYNIRGKVIQEADDRAYNE